jgi:hypothetical protein
MKAILTDVNAIDEEVIGSIDDMFTNTLIRVDWIGKHANPNNFYSSRPVYAYLEFESAVDE